MRRAVLFTSDDDALQAQARRFWLLTAREMKAGWVVLLNAQPPPTGECRVELPGMVFSLPRIPTFRAARLLLFLSPYPRKEGL